MPAERLTPTLLLLAWLAPLASFVVSAAAGSLLARRRGSVDPSAARTIGQVATGACVVSLLASLGALGSWIAEHPVGSGHAAEGASAYLGRWFTFLDVGPLRLAANYYIDALTVVMAVVVAFVAACVHVYAFGYLADEVAREGRDAVTDPEVLTRLGDPVRRAGRLHRFYQHLSLFVFAMLGIVVSGNVAMTFVFWELVGVSSYLLIGFYYERPDAARAADKAMLYNRVGDAGMLVGLMALWGLAGTLDYPALLAAAPDWLSGGPAYAVLTLAGAGLVCGCLGKSAQVPLQAWLPDAMAGPTPVSALVHSATMVAAGVFLLGRVYPLLTPEVLVGVASVGAVTLLLGAVLATAAHDIKRVLAYSTISQLGFMTLAMGLGGRSAALFHLVTHAGFKALLFLGAGSVIHATHTNDLRQMGGLRHAMPRTALLMVIGVLAILGAGVPGLGVGLSGFYSKDAVLAQAIAFGRANPAYAWLSWAPTLGAALTAAYMVRLWLMAFVGPARGEAARHAHEAPLSMLLPMTGVAAIAIAGGWALPGGLSVASVLETSPHEAPAAGHSLAVNFPSHALVHDAHHAAGVVALVAMLVGAVVSLLMHHSGRKCETPAGPLLRAADRRWLPSVGVGLAKLARGAGFVVAEVLDRFVIDGGLAAAAGGVGLTGGAVRRLQSGRLRQYVVMLALGVVVIGTASVALALYYHGGATP